MAEINRGCDVAAGESTTAAPVCIFSFELPNCSFVPRFPHCSASICHPVFVEVPLSLSLPKPYVFFKPQGTAFLFQMACQMLLSLPSVPSQQRGSSCHVVCDYIGQISQGFSEEQHCELL